MTNHRANAEASSRPEATISTQRQNYPLQLSGATVRVAIAVRVLQMQLKKRTIARLQESACS
jgi:hypothetical protein